MHDYVWVINTATPRNLKSLFVTFLLTSSIRTHAIGHQQWVINGHLAMFTSLQQHSTMQEMIYLLKPSLDVFYPKVITLSISDRMWLWMRLHVYASDFIEQRLDKCSTSIVIYTSQEEIKCMKISARGITDVKMSLSAAMHICMKLELSNFYVNRELVSSRHEQKFTKSRKSFNVHTRCYGVYIPSHFPKMLCCWLDLPSFWTKPCLQTPCTVFWPIHVEGGKAVLNRNTESNASA